MNVYRTKQAKPALPPAMFGQYGTQYIMADASSLLNVSIKQFLPNGGTVMAKMPELTYYVLSGSITVTGQGEEHILNAGDLIHFRAGEECALKANGTGPATLLVMMVSPGIVQYHPFLSSN